ncbi:19142_t:CDS:1 [Dentiscutata erythropus]|uniref:19142_t:CDS:1 n=1 Tax=Dentiscutata erythropus TaxID=1348616 RepID=A0A9N9I5L0_9GLOM|nr:19142_t:CDS:1 [Dentiscutata erythropus]
MNPSELFLHRCKLFFKASNEGKSSFFLSDVPKWLHSNGYSFFPEYIKAPPHSIHGEYSWDQKDTNKIIKFIVETLSRVYPSYFTSEMVSINRTNRVNWSSFNSSQSYMNIYEANLQDKLIKNFERLFPKYWLLGFKLLYKYDWHPVPNRPDKGRSDIILTNGKGIFAVVETKVINSSNRYEKLHDVQRQATEYKTMFLEHFADDPAVIAVIGVWFTNETHYGFSTNHTDNYTIGFSSEIDEIIAKAVEPGKSELQ